MSVPLHHHVQKKTVSLKNGNDDKGGQRLGRTHLGAYVSPDWIGLDWFGLADGLVWIGLVCHFLFFLFESGKNSMKNCFFFLRIEPNRLKNKEINSFSQNV